MPKTILFARAFNWNGKVYPTLLEAQKAALIDIMTEQKAIESAISPIQLAADQLIKHGETVREILNLTDKSRPMARRFSGAKPHRKRQGKQQVLLIEPIDAENDGASSVA